MNEKTANLFLHNFRLHLCVAVAIFVVSVCAIAPVGAALPAPTVVTTGEIKLTRTYLGSDDSAFSIRAVGDTIVGYSRDLDGQRAFVFNGTRSGHTITGQYYAIPRGEDTSTGPLTLTVSNGGATLTRTGGDDVGADVWLAKLPSAFTYPQGYQAGFQSTAANDLDGAFKGSDGSRAYVRQYGSVVVYVAEKFTSADSTRPTYSTVVIGQRSNNVLSGKFYDLPHQTKKRLRKGVVSGQVTTNQRSFNHILTRTNIPGAQIIREASFSADYAIDVDLFEQEIKNRLKPFTVGFSYAIAQDGKVVRKGAEGSRRAVTATNELAQPLPFTAETVNDVASTSKTVTLVAVLRALRKKGISVDSSVSPYLPADWVRGAGMDTVTFRQLLSHGLQPVTGNGMFKPNDCASDFYGCLQDAVATGMTQPPGYDNIHYTIFRVILPFIIDPEGMATMFATETNETALNEYFSLRFRAEIQSMLIDDADIWVDFDYPKAPGSKSAYRYQWGSPPTDEVAPTGYETSYLSAGSGALKMTAEQFAQFLSRLENGDILTQTDLAMAKAIGFGGTNPTFGPNGVGPVWGKNGGAGGGASQAMVFPGTEVFITRNSTGNAAQTNSDATMLIQAWQASLR